MLDILKKLIFLVLFLPIMMLMAVSYFVGTRWEKLPNTTFFNFVLFILLIPVMAPLTLILNQGAGWWEKLGGD